MLVLVPYVAPVATLLNLVAMLFDIPVNHRLFCLATIAAGNSWIPTTCWEVVPYAVEYGRLLRSPIGKPLPKDWQPSWFIGIVLGLFVATGIPKQHPLYTFLSLISTYSCCFDATNRILTYALAVAVVATGGWLPVAVWQVIPYGIAWTLSVAIPVDYVLKYLRQQQ